MKYNYATEVAAGACPGCGQAVILYHHVRLTSGEDRRNVTTLETIFCRKCIEHMYEADREAAPHRGQSTVPPGRDDNRGG